MKVLSSSAVRAELSGIPCNCLDNTYGVIEHRWLVEDFLPFWRGWLSKLGARWVAENWDCDKYARAFQSQMHIACFSVRASQTAAIAMVAGDHPLHAWNLLRTEKGWHEIEPQNCTTQPLRQDRATLRYAIF